MPPSFLKPLYHAVKHDATPTSGNTRSCESRGAEGCREVFQKGIREGWLVQNEREIRCVEEKWLAFKDAVIKRVGDTCGMRKLSKRGMKQGTEWWNEEINILPSICLTGIKTPPVGIFLARLSVPSVGIC